MVGAMTWIVIISSLLVEELEREVDETPAAVFDKEGRRLESRLEPPDEPDDRIVKTALSSSSSSSKPASSSPKDDDLQDAAL